MAERFPERFRSVSLALFAADESADDLSLSLPLRAWHAFRRAAFRYTSALSAGLFAIGALSLLLFCPHAFNPTVPKDSIAGLVTSLLIWYLVQLLQCLSMCSACVTQYQSLQTGRMKPEYLVNIFVALVITFAGAFFLIFLHNQSAFFVSGYAPHSDDCSGWVGVLPVLGFFFYDSAILFTSTGFGDIYPLTWYSRLVGNVEVVIQHVYTIGVFAVGLGYFAKEGASPLEGAGDDDADPDACRATLGTWLRAHFVAATLAVVGASVGACFLAVSPQTVAVFRDGGLAAVNATTVDCTTSGIVAVPGFDGTVSSGVPVGEQAVFLAVVAVVLAQVAALTWLAWRVVWTRVPVPATAAVRLGVYTAMGSMARAPPDADDAPDASPTDVSVAFLVLVGLALIVLFAVAFFALYLALGPRSFHLLDAGVAGPTPFLVDRRLDFGRALIQMLYFSVTVATTTGLGDVYPVNPAARLLVLIQAMIFYFFNVVVLGLGISHITTKMGVKWSRIAASDASDRYS